MSQPGYIGNLKTVNGGLVVQTPYGEAELLGPSYSSHNLPCVVVYANEAGVKVSLDYYGNHCVVCRFRNAESLQHYWSRVYSTHTLSQSPKYKELVVAAQRIAHIYGMYPL